MTAPLFIRAYPAKIEQTGTRSLSGLLVPYNEPAEVMDILADGQTDHYREGFRPGAFTSQASSREKGVFGRIGLIHRHDGGLGYLGPFTSLMERADGLWGEAMVMPTKAPDVMALLESGIDELSVEFRLPRSNHTVEEGGTRWRVRAHLDQVALEPKGAYSSARVLAFRAEVDEEQKEQAEVEARHRREADEEAQKLEAERLAVEAAATEAIERKRLWDEYTSRLDRDMAKQQEYVRDFGLTIPGGYGR